MSRTSMVLMLGVALAACSTGTGQTIVMSPPASQPDELVLLNKAALIDRVLALQGQLQKALRRCEQINAQLAASADEVVKLTEQLKAAVAGGGGSADPRVAELTRLLLAMRKDYQELLVRSGSERMKLQAELDQARANIASYQGQTDLAARRLTETMAQRDFLLQQVKLLREQNALLQERLNRAGQPAGSGSSGGSTSSQPDARTGAPIKARITAVSSDGTTATIGAGKAQGVTVGMRFTIFRGASFLGELEITRVDAAAAAGKLRSVQQPVQVGDQAWSKLDSP